MLSDTAPILIVDDDPDIRFVTARILNSAGYSTIQADSGAAGLRLIEETKPFLVLLDVNMPGMTGFEAIAEIQRQHGDRAPAVIFVTAITGPDEIAKCFENGARDYICKPIRPHELLGRIAIHARLRSQQLQLIEEREVVRALSRQISGEGELAQPEAFDSIVTDSPVMHQVFQYMEAISVTSRPVLVRGETGVGKELIAQTVHRLSGRSGEFVAANVAGFDDTLFSDALFGHKKGAFTGASDDREGLIARAKGGTLFLDEIGDLESAAQVKLLRLLQEGEYYPLGADAPMRSGARIIVATHCDLNEMQLKGSFRPDLYYRLMTHQVCVPPLRERRSDILVLAKHFAGKAAAEFGRPAPAIEPALGAKISAGDYPGNVRELEARIFDAVSRSPGETMSAIPFEGGGEPMVAEGAGIVFPEVLPTLRDISDLLVDEALRRCAGSQSQAAEMLGVTRQALNKRLNREK